MSASITIEDVRGVPSCPRGEFQCLAQPPVGLWICTRIRGHAGPHIAHGVKGHPMAAWHQGDAEAVEL